MLEPRIVALEVEESEREKEGGSHTSLRKLAHWRRLSRQEAGTWSSRPQPGVEPTPPLPPAEPQ
eukprot:14997819-Alexandrium_andersonii.AAC.1